MYIKYKDLETQYSDFEHIADEIERIKQFSEAVKNEIGDNDLLMSHQEFIDGGDKVKGVPVTVTPNGDEPVESEGIDERL